MIPKIYRGGSAPWRALLAAAKDGYRGGGVLYYTRGPAGTVEILLALRKYNPNKNTWSIPGGGLEPQDAGNLVRCALREAREEGFGGHPTVEAALTAAQSRELMAPGSSSVRIRLPFFDWRTLLVEVPQKPEGWPRRISEFSRAAWFSVKSLPPRTHLGVRCAVGGEVAAINQSKILEWAAVALRGCADRDSFAECFCHDLFLSTAGCGEPHQRH